MFFSVCDGWRYNGPCTDPEERDYHMVRLILNIFYYHVTVPSTDDGCGSTILCGSVADALHILQDVAGSTVLLQVPAFLNHKLKIPGLYRVNAIHQSTDTSAQPYIAETEDDRLFSLEFDDASMSLDLARVEKKTLWRRA